MYYCRILSKYLANAKNGEEKMNGSKFYAVVLFCIIIGAGIGFGAGWLMAGTPIAGPDGEMPTLKAGFIYVGPIGDFGWTHAHDVGRVYIDDKYDWLDTVYVESVDPADAGEQIDYLVNVEGCDVIFTTSFPYMDATIAAGIRHPDTSTTSISYTTSMVLWLEHSHRLVSSDMLLRFRFLSSSDTSMRLLLEQMKSMHQLQQMSGG